MHVGTRQLPLVRHAHPGAACTLQSHFHVELEDRALLTCYCSLRLFSPGIHLTNKNELEFPGHPIPVYGEQLSDVVVEYDIIPAKAESNYNRFARLQQTSGFALQIIVFLLRG
jgi:hypothetical protein